MITEEDMKKALEMRHGKELQRKFEDATVAVCGLGGLGSNITISLARAGIRKLILIDFDQVDISNLHRQQYKACQVGMKKTEALKQNIHEIAPYILVDTYHQKISEENVSHLLCDADIICEAFDQPEEKAMLVNAVLEKFPEKYLIASSGMAGMGSPNHIRTRKITKKFYLCGDEVSDVSDSLGLISSRVMLCAAHQAHMVLRILAGKFDL